jgi:hypothetical protein
MNANLKSPVFQCRQCGDCCAGRGGIHVQPGEVAAMAALLTNPDELEHAKTACPGINPACSHAEFVAAAPHRSRDEPII